MVWQGSRSKSPQLRAQTRRLPSDSAGRASPRAESGDLGDNPTPTHREVESRPPALPGGAQPARATLAQIVRQARRQRGLTLAALASRVGCAKSHLSMLENGVRPGGGASRELLIRIEDNLGLTRGVLVRAAHWERAPGEVKLHDERMHAANAAARELGALGGLGSLDEAYRSGRLSRLIAHLDTHPPVALAPGAAPPIAPRSSSRPATRASVATDVQRDEVLAALALPIEVPLINSVAAGLPSDFSDLGYPARTADEYIRSPDIRDPDAFAARVVGESMLPEYREGDLVIFSPSKPARSGQDCFVRVEPDHQTTFKRVFFETSDGRTVDVEGVDGVRAERVRLQPLNPRFAPLTLAREDVAGVYVAVSVMRTIG